MLDQKYSKALLMITRWHEPNWKMQEEIVLMPLHLKLPPTFLPFFFQKANTYKGYQMPKYNRLHEHPLISIGYMGMDTKANNLEDQVNVN